MTENKKLIYRQLKLHQQILHRPDNYVGCIRTQMADEYVADIKEDEIHISKQKIRYVPALLRIFIEAISNAIDNKWRSDEMKVPCKKIMINIDSETGLTQIWNDGFTIPIEINEQTQVYNPEMIFGKLLTSSNYDDSEQRLTSGRNGIGIKLGNIFSKFFKIKTLDSGTGLLYEQSWSDNMQIRNEPKIKKSKLKKGYTEVSWIPDFERFGMKGYNRDILKLYAKYVCDAAMLTRVSVLWNDTKLPIKNLVDYAKLYIREPISEILKLQSRNCEVILIPSQIFQPIAFTNGVINPEGGVHVDAWSEAIFRPLVNKFNKPKKPQISIRDIRQFFKLFINCIIPNPVFESNNKMRLTGPKDIKAEVTSRNITSLMKWSFAEKVRDIIRGKELLSMKKSEKKKRGFKKIEGLDPANNAGGKYGRECTLILCEGLSAKTYAVTGIQVGIDDKKGRDWYGIYPMRGKCLNVRNASPTSISKNKEITDIIQALGVRHGIDYTEEDNFRTLNYGKVMIMCDSDVDGIHIAGLILNFFHSLFPSLMDRREPFIMTMQTPIVRIFLKNSQLLFYNESRFREYIRNNPNQKHQIKYYKGLGTSSDKEVRETFGKKVLEYILDDDGTQNMNKVFNSKQANKRKKWLEEYDPNKFLEEGNRMNISDFLNTEMIKFSIDDCKRSIPHLMDGLKESHRKILYACFLRNLKSTGKSMKVAQLAGFVAEKTNYHHGEQCLFDTITKMAQDFPGSNNIPLLFRDGQFGSRLAGGKDAANARYIFTKLEKLTRLIFPEQDDILLENIVDDGDTVEPKFYVPIIPMILVNGVTAGIGTGWSSSIPCYNPRDLIECIKIWLDNDGDGYKNEDIEISQFPDIIPWYRKFEGKIEQLENGKYITRGRHNDSGRNRVAVDELPIGMWTDKFKEYLETMLERKSIKKIKNYSTPQKVKFEITECPNGAKCNERNLKLTTTLSTTNMVLFNSRGNIKKYSSADEIINEFCGVRLEYYKLRKKYTLKEQVKKYKSLKNKYRFINEVIEEKLHIFRRPEEDIIEDLKQKKYDMDKRSYDYLLNISMRSFTEKKLEELEKEIKKIVRSVKELKKTSEKEMWLQDLNKFEKAYNSFE